MKKITGILVLLMVLVGCSTKVDPSGIDVVVSFGVLEEMVTAIGADKVKVTNIVGKADAHHWEPSPRDSALLNEADMIVIVGADFEDWFASVSKSLGDVTMVVDTSVNVDLIHKEGLIDPHIWLSPLNVIKQAEVVLEALVAIDQKNASFYKSNFDDYIGTLLKVDEAYRKSGIQGTMVTNHASFGYLAKAYDLEMVSVDGLAPTSEPSMADITRVINTIRAKDIEYIFYDNEDDRKIADMIAKETGIKSALLSPLEILEKGYVDMMMDNLEVLKEALGS